MVRFASCALAVVVLLATADLAEAGFRGRRGGCSGGSCSVSYGCSGGSCSISAGCPGGVCAVPSESHAVTVPNSPTQNVSVQQRVYSPAPVYSTNNYNYGRTRFFGRRFR